MNGDTIQIDIPKRELVAAFLEKMARANGCETPMRDVPLRAVPAIGAAFHGGIYAGLTVADNDPHELVLLPGEFSGPWDKAQAWAKEQGGVLPSRFDALVLFKNLKGEFKEEWYWTGEPYAGNADFAWIQSFGNGYQSDDHKSNGYRCRAVRRVAI